MSEKSAAREAPDWADVTPTLLDSLADRGWPALERIDLEGWSLRFSHGVTGRANSVLTSGRGGVPSLAAAVDAVERQYASRGLPVVFQLSGAAPAGLVDELAGRSYIEHSPTVVMVASTAEVDAPTGSARIDIVDAPDAEWIDLWWTVDGRGGDTEREVARRILTGVPALYGSLHALGDGSGRPSCVARLALVDDWGGLFSVATHPDARRRGFARELVEALRSEARRHGVNRMWLQVMADNRAALTLYRGLGFVAASSYSYWSRPSKPAPVKTTMPGA